MKITSVFLVLILSASAGLGLEPWTQLGPTGISVSAMASVRGFPDDVYVVSRGYPARVFYTSNAGRTWVERDSVQDRVEAITVHPVQSQTLYCGGQKGRVYRSTNGGRDWTQHGVLAGGAWIRQLAFKPDQPLLMWAGADVRGSQSYVGLGVFTSSNGGADWNGTWVDTGYAVNSVLLDPDPNRNNRLFLGGSINNRARLFRSGDGGGNWLEITESLAGTHAFAAAASPVDSNTLLCATDDGVYRSTNSGNAWTRVLAAPVYSVEYSEASPYVAYAGSDNLVFRSDDDGASWDADTNEFLGTATRWLSINPELPLEVYAGSGTGVFHTTNGGHSWNELTASLHGLTIPFLYWSAPDSARLFTSPTGYGILESVDGGGNWTLVPGFPNSGMTSGLSVNPRNPDTVLAVAATSPKLHMTTDRGDSWVGYTIDELFEPMGLMHHPLGPDTVYSWGGTRDSAAGKPRFSIYRSGNHGVTWSTLLARGTVEGVCLGFEFTGSGETLHAWGSVDGGAALYRSTNRGGDWTTRNSGMTGSTVAAFDRSPADPET